MALNLEAQTFLRRIEILQRLPAKGAGLITTRELTEQLQAAGYPVEKRTIERDLGFLVTNGHWFGHLVCDDRSKPYGWCLERSTARRAQMGLTVDEALAFAWLARFGRHLLPQGMVQGIGPFFKEADARLAHDHRAQAWLKNKVRIIAARPIALPPSPDPTVGRAVSQALFDDLQVQLQYRNAQGRSSQMTASPLALVSRDLNLYLIAWIPRFANVRVLHMSRVLAAKVKEEAAEAPSDFDIDAYIAGGDLQLGGEEALVHLRFFDYAGHALLDAPMAADQTLLRQSEDGEVELTATVRVSPQLRAWLLGFGPSLEVVGPEALRAELRDALRKSVGRYKTSP